MRSSLALGLLLAPSVGLTCVVPPPHFFREHAALLDEATHVLLVEAKVAAVNSCKLEVLKSWKSSPPKVVPVSCKAPSESDWMTDFASHTDVEFWKARTGRLGIAGDCMVLPPAFIVGKQYIVLLGIAPDVKQFEQLAPAGDRWLRFIEQRFATPPTPSKTPNPSVKGTSTSGLRPLVDAPYLELQGLPRPSSQTNP